MYTLNITFKVDYTIESDWLDWMQDGFLTEFALACGYDDFRLHSLVGHDDEDGRTFVLQMYIPEAEALDQYLEKQQQSVHQRIVTRWGDRVLFFQTVLKRVIP